MKAEKSIHRFFVLALLSLLLIHFTMTLIYTFGAGASGKINHISQQYMVPMFHQNWKLFAPDLAKYNTDLQYRFANEKGWSNWLDVTEHFGFDKYSRIETVEQGFNSALNWQVVNNYYSLQGRPQFDRLVQSPAYSSALFMAMKMHKTFLPGERLDSVQIRLHYRFTPGMNESRTIQTSDLEFPIYAPSKQ